MNLLLVVYRILYLEIATIIFLHKTFNSPQFLSLYIQRAQFSRGTTFLTGKIMYIVLSVVMHLQMIIILSYW